MGLDGILRDVVPKMLQLRIASYDVIKSFRLPQASTTAQRTIDLKGATALPVPHNFTKSHLLAGCNKGMEMIGHDTPGIEIVGSAVAGDQTADQNFGALTPGEKALPMTRIEQFVKYLGKLTVIFMSFAIAKFIETVRSLKSVRTQPCVTLDAPLTCHCVGNRICKPRGHEVGRPPLLPVRKLEMVHVHFRKVIERLETHGGRK